MRGGVESGGESLGSLGDRASREGRHGRLRSAMRRMGVCVPTAMGLVSGVCGGYIEGDKCGRAEEGP